MNKFETFKNECGMYNYRIIAYLIIAFVAILMEFHHFGDIDVYLYIYTPFLIFISIIFNFLYFYKLDSLTCKFKDKVCENNYHKIEFESLRKITNSKSFLWNGACIMYSMLLAGIYTFFMMAELHFTWWAILIGIIELAFFGLDTLIISLFALSVKRKTKEIESIINKEKVDCNE